MKANLSQAQRQSFGWDRRSLDFHSAALSWTCLYNLADPSNRMKQGDIIRIIGRQQATVQFSGLAPGNAGEYQLNA
jgi:hypothetical protein